MTALDVFQKVLVCIQMQHNQCFYGPYTILVPNSVDLNQPYMPEVFPELTLGDRILMVEGVKAVLNSSATLVFAWSGNATSC